MHAGLSPSPPGSGEAIKALVLNCTLKASPQTSNTEALARVLADAFRSEEVECEVVRVVDRAIPAGVESDQGEGDEWPAIREKILDSEIVVVASPTWLGQPSSVAKRVLERMDAMLSETDDAGRPVAYNRVAGVVVTGNEDGAHHVISEIAGALIDIGFTVPGQAWTYWNRGPGPGDDYLDSDEGHDWSESTGRAAASNLLHAARALEARPIPPPPS
ncbi:MAG TPA: NAD(P)H-dependent oxidoreductase [Solirubrobacterales bacterium]|nr:NAD(P)H-dependent oxidoreductase [Solirubrobacterales bacterium]